MPELTRVERWILSNQFRILEALYPDEAEELAYRRRALENGYELEYTWISEQIYDDRHVMTEEECKEVIEILDMFSFIKRTYDELADKSGIEEFRVRFAGFDGNYETRQLGYAHHFLERGDRFKEIDRRADLNSHCPVLEPYRHMLAEWNKSKDKYHLTKDDLLRITAEWKYDS